MPVQNTKGSKSSQRGETHTHTHTQTNKQTNKHTNTSSTIVGAQHTTPGTLSHPNVSLKGEPTTQEQTPRRETMPATRQTAPRQKENTAALTPVLPNRRFAEPAHHPDVHWQAVRCPSTYKSTSTPPVEA